MNLELLRQFRHCSVLAQRRQGNLGLEGRGVIAARSSGHRRLLLEQIRRLPIYLTRAEFCPTDGVHLSDRCVSLTNASEQALANYAASAPTSFSNTNSYGKLLHRIHQQPWFSRPKSGFGCPLEEEAWSMRVALLDAFIYLPKAR